MSSTRHPEKVEFYKDSDPVNTSDKHIFSDYYNLYITYGIYKMLKIDIASTAPLAHTESRLPEILELYGKAKTQNIWDLYFMVHKHDPSVYMLVIRDCNGKTIIRSKVGNYNNSKLNVHLKLKIQLNITSNEEYIMFLPSENKYFDN